MSSPFEDRCIEDIERKDKRIADFEQQLAKAQGAAVELAKENHDLAKSVQELTRKLAEARGAMIAQDDREREAGIRCKLPYEEYGCDLPDALADEILFLRERIKILESKANNENN